MKLISIRSIEFFVIISLIFIFIFPAILLLNITINSIGGKTYTNYMLLCNENIVEPGVYNLSIMPTCLQKLSDTYGTGIIEMTIDSASLRPGDIIIPHLWDWYFVNGYMELANLNISSLNSFVIHSYVEPLNGHLAFLYYDMKPGFFIAISNSELLVETRNNMSIYKNIRIHHSGVFNGSVVFSKDNVTIINNNMVVIKNFKLLEPGKNVYNDFIGKRWWGKNGAPLYGRLSYIAITRLLNQKTRFQNSMIILERPILLLDPALNNRMFTSIIPDKIIRYSIKGDIIRIPAKIAWLWILRNITDNSDPYIHFVGFPNGTTLIIENNMKKIVYKVTENLLIRQDQLQKTSKLKIIIPQPRNLTIIVVPQDSIIDFSTRYLNKSVRIVNNKEKYVAFFVNTSTLVKVYVKLKGFLKINYVVDGRTLIIKSMLKDGSPVPAIIIVKDRNEQPIAFGTGVLIIKDTMLSNYTSVYAYYIDNDGIYIGWVKIPSTAKFKS